MKLDLIWDPCYKNITAWSPPKEIEWVRDGSGQFEVYIDNMIPQVLNSKTTKKKVAILLESGGHYQSLHDQLKNYWNKFEYIFTFDLEMLKLPNAKPLVYGGIYYSSDVPKTKNVSFCCSNKRMIPSHLERLKLADMIHTKVDMKGNYKAQYASAKEIYEDYRFSIVFECEYTPLYFTEKLCNAFATKCVPINYGCTDLASFGFNIDGVIQINNIQQIVDLVNSDFNWEEEYNKRKSAIEHNYEIVKKFRCTEDTWYDMYKDLLYSIK